MAHAVRYLRRAGAGLLALALGAVAWAQTPAAPAVRFTVFAPKPVHEVGYMPRSGAPLQTMTFQPTSRSPRYEYRGTMPLRFVDAVSGAIVAEANIPPGLRDALLLFTPVGPAAGKEPKSGLRYHVAVLDDSFERHGSGGLAIVNLSGLALVGTVNKGIVTLKAGLNPTLEVGRNATIALRTTVNQRSYPAFSAKLGLTPRQRALLLLFPPFNPGSVEVQSRMLIDEPAAPARTR
jgi:hypothetical protein